MTPPLVDLVPFGTDVGAERSPVRAGVARIGTTLSLAYAVEDQNGRWRIDPAHGGTARADRLWEHTCFEAFLAPAGSPDYWEVNLAASGAWNVYRFTGYREGMTPEQHALPPAVAALQAPSFQLTATVDLRALPSLRTAALDVGLSVVLESHDAAHSYWALRHAAERPDFHRRESFTVRLPAGDAW